MNCLSVENFCVHVETVNLNDCKDVLELDDFLSGNIIQDKLTIWLQTSFRDAWKILRERGEDRIKQIANGDKVHASDMQILWGAKGLFFPFDLQPTQTANNKDIEQFIGSAFTEDFAKENGYIQVSNVAGSNLTQLDFENILRSGLPHPTWQFQINFDIAEVIANRKIPDDLRLALRATVRDTLEKLIRLFQLPNLRNTRLEYRQDTNRNFFILDFTLGV